MPTYPIAPTRATANLPAPVVSESAPQPITLDALRAQVDEMIQQCGVLRSRIAIESPNASTAAIFSSRLESTLKKTLALRAELETTDERLVPGAQAVRDGIARELNTLDLALYGDQAALQGLAEAAQQERQRSNRFLIGAGVSFALGLGALLAAAHYSKSHGTKGVGKAKRPKFKRLALPAR